MKPIVTSQDRKLVEALQASALYRGYQEAFHSATGMAMFLRLAHTEQIPRITEREQQNAFCESMAACGGATECSRAHDHLRAMPPGGDHACSGSCFAKMMETAVPIQCGGGTMAWLWTGQVFVEADKPRSFKEVGRILSESGIGKEEIERLRALWESTPEVTAEKYRSVVVLLEAFGKQLSELANRLIIEARPRAPHARRNLPPCRTQPAPFLQSLPPRRRSEFDRLHQPLPHRDRPPDAAQRRRPRLRSRLRGRLSVAQPVQPQLPQRHRRKPHRIPPPHSQAGGDTTVSVSLSPSGPNW